MDVGPIDPASTTTSLGDRALAEGIERYASMFDYHPHAAYSVDRRGYYTDANALAREMTGLSLEQMRQTHFADTIHPDDRALMQDAFEQALSGEPIVVDARVLRADGVVIDIRCSGIPVVVGGEVVGVHGVTEDVTRAKQVLRELEEANTAKTLFVATVSHELRTPLAALVGATDLLLHTELAAEPQHYARLVHRSSQRLMHLVEELLEFSGLEAHQTLLHTRPFDVRTVADAVAAWAVPLACERGLAISFSVDGSVPTAAVGDARRITQVVTNLVRNALTFTESGSVEVRVRARPPAPDPGDAHGTDTWVEFSVTDTGVGIEQDRVATLFEPFTRPEDRSVRAPDGIGLGLAICRALADLMQGVLRVSSSPGEGSTFTFGVPLGRVDGEVSASS